MYLILILSGILCLVYFVCIAFFVGHGTNFYFIWLFLGLFAIFWGILIKKGIWEAHFPRWFRRIFIMLFCISGILFVVVEGCILSGFSKKGIEGLDYLVVLGAQMKASGPSKALQYRLDEAIRYLEENPDTQVIVSGGQGPDEHISEAQGMYDYLVGRGIAPERIIREDQSRNTSQNINYSSAFLDKEKDSVGIVTNNFHIFRATYIAKKSGYKQVCGIAAPSEWMLLGNNMLREFAGVVKDFLVGNI